MKLAREGMGPMQIKVLLVDDDPMVSVSYKRALDRNQFAVISAESGEEALKILETEPGIQIVVSDEQMPSMHGTELLRIVKERYPRPIRILLTAYADVPTAMKAVNEGEVYRFLTKPVSPVDLAMTFRLAMERQTLLARSRELLERYREQYAILERLKKQKLEDTYPGITNMRTESGRITIGEDIEAVDYDKLLLEMDEVLSKSPGHGKIA